MNPNPVFKVTPFFDAEYLTNGYRYGQSYYRRQTGNCTQAGSQIEAGSLIQAWSPIQARSRFGATW